MYVKAEYQSNELVPFYEAIARLRSILYCYTPAHKLMAILTGKYDVICDITCSRQGGI